MTIKHLGYFRNRTGLVVLSLIAAGALAFGITASATASIPSAAGTINSCYDNGGNAPGALSVIDSAATCPTGTTALNWSQTGTGGSSGLDLKIVRATASITAEADCPSDHPFLYGGGGYDANATELGYSAPVSGGSLPASTLAEDGASTLGWQVRAFNGANDTVVAYAICGK
jgi:hypothetical protein